MIDIVVVVVLGCFGLIFSALVLAFQNRNYSASNHKIPISGYAAFVFLLIMATAGFGSTWAQTQKNQGPIAQLQQEEVEFGRVRQFVIDRNGEKHYLDELPQDEEWYNPETTYYYETWVDETVYWIFYYKSQRFTFVQGPADEESPLDYINRMIDSEDE